MSTNVQQALLNDRLIDITTIGRKSGSPSRKEIGFHNLGGDIYITGLPGKRDWYANVVANPSFTFHLKESAEADLEASAMPITDPDQKREILEQILPRMDRAHEIDRWVSDSPLIEVDLAAE